MLLEEFDAEWRRYIQDWEAAGGDFRQLLRDRAAPSSVSVLYVTDDGEEELSIELDD